MTWTKTKPSAPGWYWYKPGDEHNDWESRQIVEVDDGGVVYMAGSDVAYDINESKGEFAGPIPEPDQPVYATLHGPDGPVRRVLIHQPKKPGQG